jgi:hypothetical protein
MRRSPSSHTLLLRLTLILTGVPFALVAFTQAAWAATVPVASPGPPFVPFSAPTGDPRAILVTAALVGVAGVVAAVLMAGLGAHHQNGVSPAARPALRQKITGRSVDRAGDGDRCRLRPPAHSATDTTLRSSSGRSG